jgi:hypothetical protein
MSKIPNYPFKELLRTGLLPVWWLCRHVRLAVTANGFELEKAVWYIPHRASFMVI